MKILYGVQGTGNGHISRARKMAAHFRARGADVTWLFSGRERDRLFDMEVFGDFEHRTGLTMSMQAGRLSYRQTVAEAKPLRFLRDVATLDLAPYDLVVTDFEPVTAWAAKLRGKPSIGIGHQYVFAHPVPRNPGNPLANGVLRWFAPATIAIGLHWHHFDCDILPPIIDTRLAPTGERSHTLVYLPFEDQAAITALLHRFPEQRFVQYAPSLSDNIRGNVVLRNTSLHGFRSDLVAATGVICNAGFELVSEALHLGLPVLVKPVHGQIEQLSNARALAQLGWGTAVNNLTESILAAWLAERTAVQVRYPDVAAALVDWLLSGEWNSHHALWETLWDCTRGPVSPHQFRAAGNRISARGLAG